LRSDGIAIRSASLWPVAISDGKPVPAFPEMAQDTAIASASLS
jgi:hypothetical protein